MLRNENGLRMCTVAYVEICRFYIEFVTYKSCIKIRSNSATMKICFTHVSVPYCMWFRLWSNECSTRARYAWVSCPQHRLIYLLNSSYAHLRLCEITEITLCSIDERLQLQLVFTNGLFIFHSYSNVKHFLTWQLETPPQYIPRLWDGARDNDKIKVWIIHKSKEKGKQ